MGFTRVIELLIKARKPIIGHNMAFDSTFIFDSYIDRLPATYVDFAKKWKQNFPEIYDTKVIAVNTPCGQIPKTELNHLFNMCKSTKRFSNNLEFEYDDEADSKFSAYLQGGQKHDAGYDAYMTGIVFAYHAKFIEIGNLVQPMATKKAGAMDHAFIVGGSSQ